MTWIRCTLHLAILNVTMVVKPGFYPPFTKATGSNSLSLWTLVLRSAFFLNDWKISNGDLHALVGPPSPSQYFKYSHAIAMYNVLKHECPLNVRLSAQFDFIFHEWKNQILFTSNNYTKVGLISLSNHFNFESHML